MPQTPLVSQDMAEADRGEGGLKKKAVKSTKRKKRYIVIGR